MKIVLNELDDFLAEVTDVAEEGDSPVVRYLIDVSTDNENGYSVYLFVSFVTEDEVICELEYHCGKDLRMAALPQRDHGSIIAAEMIEKTKASCGELGIKVRPGRYEDQ